jgi:hypothetical protein
MQGWPESSGPRKMMGLHPVSEPKRSFDSSQDPPTPRSTSLEGARAVIFLCVIGGLGLIAWIALDLRSSLERAVMISETPFVEHRLNPLTATLPEWTLVPGVGPAVAGRIDAARRSKRFERLEDVPGVGPITLRDAAPHLRHPSSRVSGRGIPR